MKFSSGDGGRFLSGLLGAVYQHQDLLRIWLNAWRNRGGSFLFLGPAGIGKKMAAKALAQVLLCESPEQDLACGHCGSCLRVAKNQSEGLVLLEPENLQIKVEQSRQVLEYLQLKQWGKARVIIIDPASSLNPQSANALLKTLEEPTPGVFFFLIAHSLGNILPTIASRCQILRFKSLELESLKKISTAPDWVYRACHGSAESLLELQNSEEIEFRQQCMDFLDYFFSHEDLLVSGSWRESWKNKRDFLKLIKICQFLFHDVLLLRAFGLRSEEMQVTAELVRDCLKKSDAFYCPDQENLLARICQLPLEKQNQQIDLWRGFEQDININRDPILQLEEAWVEENGAH